MSALSMLGLRISDIEVGSLDSFVSNRLSDRLGGEEKVGCDVLS
jgi:hypothetical protein